MFARRRIVRRSTWAVLAAFVFSTFAMAPLGLHAHTIGAGAEFHPDLCTAHAADNSTTASLAVAPDKKSSGKKRCNDCAGCGGGAVALPPPIAPWLAVAEAVDPIVIAPPPAAAHDDPIVARPRGPPVPA